MPNVYKIKGTAPLPADAEIVQHRGNPQSSRPLRENVWLTWRRSNLTSRIR